MAALLLLSWWVVRHDLLLLHGSRRAIIARVALPLQALSLLCTLCSLAAALYREQGKALAVSALAVSLFFHSLAMHAPYDDLNDFVDSWYGLRVKSVSSGPSDPVISCDYAVPFVDITGADGSKMSIFVGVYPYRLDPEVLMATCKGHNPR